MAGALVLLLIVGLAQPAVLVEFGALLEVVVSGDRVARGGTAGVMPKPGSHAWRDDGRVPRIENVGSAEFALVEIEWKP